MSSKFEDPRFPYKKRADGQVIQATFVLSDHFLGGVKFCPEDGQSVNRYFVCHTHGKGHV